MKLYHVSANGWKPGGTIRPGNWGKQSRQFGKGHGFFAYGNLSNANIVGWEVALEVARQLTAPDAPSRFNCVFCIEDIESARAFRDRFQKGAGIYEVEVDETTNRHLGNYNAITDPPDGAYVDVNVATAKSYWTDAPTGIREILVGGVVTVASKIE